MESDIDGNPDAHEAAEKMRKYVRSTAADELVRLGSVGFYSVTLGALAGVVETMLLVARMNGVNLSKDDWLAACAHMFVEGEKNIAASNRKQMQ